MGLLSLFFNTVLLYLIKRHSNFASRVYTVMLTIDASLDLLLSVFVLFGQPVCLVGDGYKLYFSDGYFAGRSDWLDQFLVFGWEVCPLVTCSVSVMFIMSVAITGANPGINQVFLTMATSSITVFNPLTTMFFMRSYRSVIVKKLWRRKVSDLPADTRITGISLAVTTQA